MFRGLFASFRYNLCSATSWIIRSSNASRDKSFPHSRKRQTSLKPTQPPIQRVGIPYLGLRRPGREFDHWTSFRNKFKTKWRWTSTPTIGLHEVDRNNFTFLTRYTVHSCDIGSKNPSGSNISVYLAADTTNRILSPPLWWLYCFTHHFRSGVINVNECFRLLVGAPRGNSTHPNHLNITEPGMVYQCRIEGDAECSSQVLDYAGIEKCAFHCSFTRKKWFVRCNMYSVF